MKNSFKYLIGFLAATLIVALSASAATIFTPSQGGTGTGTRPLAGQVLIGTTGRVYSPAYLTAGSNITISTSSGAITISSTGGSGTTTINGVSASAFTFNTGTSGNDFNISTSSATITFNCPTASASNRGCLSTANWSTFNGKQDAITGAATSITSSNLTASRALISDSSGKVTISTTTATELGFVNGVTSAIQTQLNGKATTTTTISAGTGLTGGGDLSANRTVSLNINSGTTQNCGAGQFASSITGVGIIGCGTPTGALKLPTITVASSGGDYSNLAAAVIAAANTATYPDGALLYLPDSAYSVTTTLKLANGVNITGNSHQTTINFTATSTGTATNPGSVLFQASGTTPGNIGLSNLILNQSNGGFKGTALDMSNMALLKVNNIQSIGFKYGIYANDTANNTFYNNITNWASFDDNCIYASSTNPVNDNTFVNIRCGFNSGNNTTSTYGLYLNNGQDNNFYNFNAEPAHPTGAIGVDLQSANALSNSFFGLYAEANATSVLIGTNAANNSFFGGQVCCHTVTSISDGGKRTLFLGLNDNFTGLATSTVPAPLYVKDYSANSLTNLFQNNNSFAHIGSNLVTMQLLNGSDTSGVLKLDNAGTGPSLVVKGGTVQATGTVATVSSCGTSPTIIGTSVAGKVTTGTNATSTCTVTFPVSFNLAPACIVTSQTTSSINYVAATTATTLKIQTASSSAFASNQLNYICIGF